MVWLREKGGIGQFHQCKKVVFLIKVKSEAVAHVSFIIDTIDVMLQRIRYENMHGTCESKL